MVLSVFSQKKVPTCGSQEVCGKPYAFLYPGILSVWAPITYAYEKGYAHLEFMDAGLPFKKHGYRDFILRFGGKQSSTRRWFRFSWKWLNKLLCKFYI